MPVALLRLRGCPRTGHAGLQGPTQPMPRPHCVRTIPEARPPVPSLQGHSTTDSVVQDLFSTTSRNTHVRSRNRDVQRGA